MSAQTESGGSHRDIKTAIVDLVGGFTIETTPRSAEKVDNFANHLAKGTRVMVTFLPGSDFADTVTTCKRLKKDGMKPAPHFAARSIPSRQTFEGYLKRLQDEVGVEEVVALAGGVDKPLGPFKSSMDLLELGLFEEHGITKIGVAGHPEGSPDISDKDLKHAIAWKNEYAEKSSADFYICTQFVFEADPVIAWDKKLRSEGNELPIHIGLPGLATLKTLISMARASGVGASMRFITRQARNVTKLMSVAAPDKLVTDLARYSTEDPECDIRTVHIYALGGLRRSAAWINQVKNGDIKMKADNKGFEVSRPID